MSDTTVKSPTIQSDYLMQRLLEIPHARRMLCAFMRQSDQWTPPWDGLFFTCAGRLPEPEHKLVGRLMVGEPTLARTEEDRIKLGSVGIEDVVKCLAPAAASARPARDTTSICVSFLANPAVSADVLERLWCLPENSHYAKLAMQANPNFKRRGREPLFLAEEDKLFYAGCLAKHGDLNDAEVAGFIGKHAFNEAAIAKELYEKSDKSRLRETILFNLSNRGDLPDGMVQDFLNAIPVSSRHFVQFAKNPTFCNMVSSGSVVYSEKDYEGMLVQGVGMALCPKLPSKVVAGLFEKAESRGDAWRQVRDRIAAHPNAWQGLVDRALEGDGEKAHFFRYMAEEGSPWVDYAAEAVFFSQAPIHSDRILIEHIGEAENVSPATLREASGRLVSYLASLTGTAREDATSPVMARLVCHPRFPLDEENAPKLLRWVPAHSRAGLACLMVAKGIPAEKLTGVADAAYLPLFDERLSSKKINALVAKNPELNILAAAHPNGNDVQLLDEQATRLGPLFSRIPSLAGGRASTGQVAENPLCL